MNILLFGILIISVLNLECYGEEFENGTWYGDTPLARSDVLSRRKRYLIFPDRSSFQLVFCAQNQGYLQIGDVVWFGNTAALAWELPSDPALFNIFLDRKKVYGGNRRSDIQKHIYYLDDKGKVLKKVPYKKRPIVNPAFAKRSVDSRVPVEKKLPIKKMHEVTKEVNYLKNLAEDSAEFHRHGRKDLYTKVEKFLQTMGWNGRECVLRLLCESRNAKKSQGTFLEEIVRATFTLPKGREFEEYYHKQYDVAHGSDGDCARLYPACEDTRGLQLYESS